MAEEVTVSPEQVPEGQAETPPEGTSVEAPTVPEGQAAEPRSGQAQAPETEETFFNPADLPEDPNVQRAYKQMRAAFTKAMQGVSSNRQKLEAYEAFERAPVETIRQAAAQLGLEVVPAGQRGQSAENAADWQPQSWEELLAKAEERAEQRVLSRLDPVLQRFKSQTAKTVEQQLDDLDPMWRTYEGAMRTNLQTMPHLADDIEKLYKISVPDEVLEARYTQRMMSKMKSQTSNALVEGSSPKKRTSPAPPQVKTFQDAIDAAREARRRAGG